MHQLNGVTRLLVAIGLSSANDNLQSLYYGFMNPSYMTVSHLAVGDTFRFHQQHSKLSYGVQQMFKSLHVMMSKTILFLCFVTYILFLLLEHVIGA